MVVHIRLTDSGKKQENCCIVYFKAHTWTKVSGNANTCCKTLHPTWIEYHGMLGEQMFKSSWSSIDLADQI